VSDVALLQKAMPVKLCPKVTAPNSVGVTRPLPVLAAHTGSSNSRAFKGKIKGLMLFPSGISPEHSNSVTGLHSGHKLIAALKMLQFAQALMLL